MSTVSNHTFLSKFYNLYSLQAPSSKDLSNRDYLMYLINAREMKLFAELAEKMAKAGREGTFKTWMLEESDLIQAAARAYGERLVSERFYSIISGIQFI